MNKEKIDKFLKWLKQPSTIKAIVLFASLVGIKFNPDKTEGIITSAIILYGGIAAFYDKG